MIQIDDLRAEQMETWPLARLRPNDANPRGLLTAADVADLVGSIREQGILQSLLITPDGTVVAGHRRLLAARLAGLAAAPVMVRDLSVPEQIEIMLAENVLRCDLTPLQEARAYRQLADAGRTQADIARATGVTTSRVHLRLGLLRLDAAVQQMCDRAELPLTLALTLAKVGDPAAQRRLAMLASRKRLSVAELEGLVRRHQGVLNDPPRPALKVVPKSLPMDEDEVSVETPRITRRAAVALLASYGRQSLIFADVADAVDGVCGICQQCGMASIEAICRECPIPQLAERLARR